MEVISLFTSEKEVLDLFYSFINTYDKLSMSATDKDTAYFINNENGNNEIYFHFVLNDLASELSYNYSEKEIGYIKKYFEEYPIFLFDISYRDNLFLNDLLQAFFTFLKQQKEITINKILLSHPFEGLKIIW